jgi:hypothetical protein
MGFSLVDRNGLCLKMGRIWIFQILPLQRIFYSCDKIQNPLRHCKKRWAVFPSPGGMSLTKLSLAGENLIIPAHGEFGQLHPGWGRENR